MTSTVNNTTIRSGDVRAVAMAVALDKPNGGFSVDPRNGQDIVSGYAVAVHPDRERQIGGLLSEKDIKDFAYDNADLLAVPGSIFGGWRNPEDGIAYLDVSVIVHDRAEALRLARDHNQIAVWDFARGVEIKA